MATDTIYNYTPWSELTPDQKQDAVSQRRTYGSDKVAQMNEDAKTLTAVTGMYHSARTVVPLANPYISGLMVPNNLQVLCSKPWTVPGCNDYTSTGHLQGARKRALTRRQNAS